MGVVEAPILKLSVVNVGNRQRGRQHSENIIFVPNNKAKIIKAVKKCLLDPSFKKGVMKCKNPYGNGLSGKKVADILAKIKINDKLLRKRMAYWLKTMEG